MESTNKNQVGNDNISENANSGDGKSNKESQPRSLALAQNEIRTTRDYGQLMAALITDVIQEKISPTVLFAAVAAGRQMVKVAELNLRYGNPKKQVQNENNKPCLNLLSGQVE